MSDTFRAKTFLAAFCFLLSTSLLRADVLNMSPGLTSLQFVTIGNPGNAADTAVMNDGTTGYGVVDYTYDIGKFDVTAAQYCEFLNAVAKSSDPYGLYNPYMDTANNSSGCNITRALADGKYTYSVAAQWANRPVNYVSWGDAIRFCNWLQNGQPLGVQDATTTENGAYFINGATTDALLLNVTRKADAKFFLPSENEWYKAAYYDPDKPGGAGYWKYATQSYDVPSNALSPTGTNNANFNSGGYTVGTPYYRNEVGAFAASPSAYGTYDQAGNVNQWIERKLTVGPNSYRGLRGGSYSSTTSNALASTLRNYTVPSGDAPTTGFRIASILQMETYFWKGGGGDTMTAWGVADNWAPRAAVPDGPGVKVEFGVQNAACSIVDMVSVGRTVGGIKFDAATSTLIQSTYGHALSLDGGNKTALVEVAGSHFISAPVILKSDARISGDGMLTLWNGISGSHTLTVTGKLTTTTIQVDKLVITSTATAQSVPEPGVFSLLLIPGLALAAFAWRRYRSC